jgi:hypothetical protein
VPPGAGGAQWLGPNAFPDGDATFGSSPFVASPTGEPPSEAWYSCSAMEKDPAVRLKQLADLIVGSEDFALISARTRKFCPFEAVGMARQEIRHSNFLSYILTPARPHGLGEAPLRALLMQLVKDEHVRRLDLNLRDLSDAKVFRERDNIDLLIEIPADGPAIDKKGLVIAVELKIDAGESPGQLETYASRVQHRYSGRWEHRFCFLTPDGRKAETASKPRWTPLRLTDLLNAIHEALERTGLHGEGRQFFDYYHTMMKRRRIVDGSEDPKLDKAVEQIWMHHREALDFLMEKRPSPMHDLLREVENEGDDYGKKLDPPKAEVFKPIASVTNAGHLNVRFRPENLAAELSSAIRRTSKGVEENNLLMLQATAEADKIFVSFRICPERDTPHAELRQFLIEEMNKFGEQKHQKTSGVKHYWRDRAVFTWEDLLDDGDSRARLLCELKKFVKDHYGSVECAVKEACKRVVQVGDPGDLQR